MFITQLQITNFRNIHATTLTFNKNLNIFYGDNAQGKTSIVEAIGFLSTMKSFREEEDRILINSENDFFKIKANFINNHIDHQVEVLVDRKDKSIQFDGEKNIPSGEFMGSVNVVTFAPSDVNLFKEAPKQRRDFLDDELSKLSPAYRFNKIKFNQILKERNELLKLEPIDELMLQVVNEQFAKSNYEIMKRRQEFISKLNRYLSFKYQSLSEQSQSELEIEYETFLTNQECSYSAIYEHLVNTQNDDIKKQSSQSGVHRDDFVMYLNNLDVAKFGSQGQMRLCAIALKLALIEVIKEKNEDDAIIVLDDVLSELDATRQHSLIHYLKTKNQIFLTTAHIREIQPVLKDYECDYWAVKDGLVSKEDVYYGK